MRPVYEVEIYELDTEKRIGNKSGTCYFSKDAMEDGAYGEHLKERKETEKKGSPAEKRDFSRSVGYACLPWIKAELINPNTREDMKAEMLIGNCRIWLFKKYVSYEIFLDMAEKETKKRIFSDSEQDAVKLAEIDMLANGRLDEQQKEMIKEKLLHKLKYTLKNKDMDSVLVPLMKQYASANDDKRKGMDDACSILSGYSIHEIAEIMIEKML